VQTDGRVKIDKLVQVATPARDRHARRREQTRAKLVEAARTLFARHGVDNTRINEITDEADVGFGSFYNHFDRKEAIVEAVLADTVAAQGEAIEAVTRQLEDPAEARKRGSKAVVRRDGWVAVGGELWRARSADGAPLVAGEHVTVESVQEDLELVVGSPNPTERA